MEDLIRAASALDHFCQDRGWKYCFIGGLALQYWGLPRLTRDVNLCLLTGFGNEAAFVDPLLGAFASRIAEARQFAIDNRILLLTTPEGIALDISLGRIPYEAKVVERSRSVEFLPKLRFGSLARQRFAAPWVLSSRHRSDLHNLRPRFVVRRPS